MNEFVALFFALEANKSLISKQNLLTSYLKGLPSAQLLFATALFLNRKPKKCASSTDLKEWLKACSDYPDWLISECYHHCGDLAETLNLLIPEGESSWSMSLSETFQFLKELKSLPKEEVKKEVIHAWKFLSSEQRLVFNKLMTGGFRIGVSEQLFISALASSLNVEKSTLITALTGYWNPFTDTIEKLLSQNEQDPSKPYPFCLAYPIENEVSELGDISKWQFEYKWDGIRCQLVKRDSKFYLWSRGEELITDQFPEFVSFQALPDGTVLDGEIIALGDANLPSFSHLQSRLNRKKPSKKLIQSNKASFYVFDLMEWNGQDFRGRDLISRMSTLAALCSSYKEVDITLPQLLNPESWEEVEILRQEAKNLGAEGLMIKRKDSPYSTGRKKGVWFKHKIDPFSIDAVLIYAQKGHGQRSGLYTDYTFALWKDGSLLPFAKSYSGLTKAEINEIDTFIKRNTIEKFGPVRTVQPELVFEISFEGVTRSKRHKSGYSVRFPRITRIRKDLKPEDANSVDDLAMFCK